MPRLENQRAKGRAQGERNETGDGHGQRNGDCKLLIQFAGNASQKCNRYKHGSQHQNDCNHWPRNFIHGFLRRILRRQASLSHMAFNILHNHDRIIHHDTNCQHHAKESERIDRKSQGFHAGKRSNERNGDRNGRNKGRTPALKEKKHDQDNQQHCLDQCFHHFLDRYLDEYGRVIRDVVAYPGGKALSHLIHFLAHPPDGIERIGSGCEKSQKKRIGSAIPSSLQGRRTGPPVPCARHPASAPSSRPDKPERSCPRIP